MTEVRIITPIEYAVIVLNTIRELRDPRLRFAVELVSSQPPAWPLVPCNGGGEPVVPGADDGARWVDDHTGECG
jgi:hypothetical protein